MAKRRQPAPKPQVTRSIRFYRANAGRGEDGAPLPFDARSVFQHINGLPFTDDGRYLVTPDDTVLCCWVDRLAAPQRVRLASIRRSGLPELEQAGALSPLNIPTNSGLAEIVHVAFLPSGIVGADFNFFGPRVSRLGPYLIAKAGELCPQLAFEPLLRLDVSAQLDRLSDIRVFDLKVRESYSSEIRNVDSDLGSAFRAAARAGEAEVVGVVLAPKPYSRGSIGNRLLETAKSLARRRDIRDNASRFRVKGFDPLTGNVEEIDVLRDQLITAKQIVRLNERTRVLDPNSAFPAIEQAHEEMQSDLQEAAGVALQ